jgi:ABC-2 type transport system permease protein
MIRTLALIRFDLRALLRERGTLLLLTASLLLALYGLFEGSRFQQHTQAAHRGASSQEATAREAAKDLAARYFANPDDPAFAGLLYYRTPVDVRGYAFREHVGFAALPALPGAALAIGLADIQPSYVRVRAESMASVETAAEIEHPTRLASGRYDLMFFVVYLWPLVLLTLTASVLTQDRESMRLRSLLLQGVGAGRIVFVQAGVRSLLATMLLMLLVAGAAFALGAVPFNRAGLSALGHWAGILALYSAFWCAVAIAVCAFCANRMSAAFAGFGLWLLFAIVIPAALDAVTRVAAPVPPRERYVQATRDALDQVNADQAGSLARFYDSHPEWRPRRTAPGAVSSNVSRLHRAQEIDRIMAEVAGEFALAENTRATFFVRMSVLSPVSLANAAFANAAGNDRARHHRFIAEVASHQGHLRDWFQDVIQRAALGDEQAPCSRTCLGGYGFREFDAVPRFAASSALALPSGVLARTWTLLAWACAFAMLALIALGLERGRQHR